MASCLICCDDYLHADGFFCVNKHFVCWENCFDPYLESAGKPGAIGRSVDKVGNLMCPCPDCSAPYDIQTVAKSGPPRAFNALMALQLNIKAQNAAEEARDEERRRNNAEFIRIQQIKDVDERGAALLHLEITDSILNLRCPRCKVAFAEFDGCMALTCGQNSCRAGICAWCLKDCGGDAHQHVLKCPSSLSKGSYFGTAAQFESHHKNRRKELVLARLKKEPAEVQKRTKALLEVPLKNLGITL